jgi:hypothetical protein
MNPLTDPEAMAPYRAEMQTDDLSRIDLAENTA